MQPRRIIVLAATTLVCALAQAGAYRCQVGNRTVYQDTPCPGVKSVSPAIKTNAVSARSAEEARLRAEDEMRRANAISEERARQIDKDLREANARRNDEALKLHAKAAHCGEMEIEIRRIEDTAKGYPDDPWWQNYAVAERNRFNRDCR